MLAGFAARPPAVGLDRLRAGRHRIEHVEMVDKATDRAAGRVRASSRSVQPAFDRLWGGGAGMYAERLGLPRGRWRRTRSARWPAVGVALAFGLGLAGDAAGPVGAVRAAVAAPQPGVSGSSARAAFAAHTRGGWRAAGRDDDGVLTPGAPATFAVWDATGLDPATGLPPLGPDDPTPRCLRTVVRGVTVHDTLG